jgi:integrase
MAEALEAAGLPAFRFHDLRHSCGSYLYSRGANLKTIQLILGHSSYQITANIYLHIDTAKMSEAMNHFDDLLPAAMGSVDPNRRESAEAAMPTSVN